MEIAMTTKIISSTEAQNNFGRILDDVVQNDARYIIRRRSASQVIVLGLADFEQLLAANEGERREIGNVIRELSPVYNLGNAIDA
jgi:prevent-host-death family protein